MDDKFIFVVKPTDRQAMVALARADGLSQAAVLRQLVRREARERGFLPPATEAQGTREQIRSEER